MIELIPTGCGGYRLYDEQNYSYRVDKKIIEVTFWKCIEDHCRARVHTRDGNPVKIIRTVGVHSHTSNPSKPVTYKAKSELKFRSKTSTKKSRSLISEALKNLDTNSLTILQFHTKTIERGLPLEANIKCCASHPTRKDWFSDTSAVPNTRLWLFLSRIP